MKTIYKKKLLLLLIIIPIFVVVSALYQYGKKNHVSPQVNKKADTSVQSAYTVLATTKELNNFSHYIELAQDAPALQANNGSYTVFAPTNQALQKLPSNSLSQLFEQKNYVSLVDFVHNHLILGRYRTKDFVDGMTLTTVHGSKLTFTQKNGDWYINDTAKITTPETVTKNGVIYAIDSALVPKLSIISLQNLPSDTH